MANILAYIAFKDKDRGALPHTPQTLKSLIKLLSLKNCGKVKVLSTFSKVAGVGKAHGLNLLTLIFCLLILSVLSACVGGYGSGKDDAYERFRENFFGLFDTVSFFVAYAQSPEEFGFLSQEIVGAELYRLHQLFDIYNEYQGINNLYTVNKNAGIAPVEVDIDIINMLQLSVEAYYISGGLVNIAIGPLTEIWREARSSGIRPSMEALRLAGGYTDIGGLIIDLEANTVFLKHEAMSLDVGTIAKGFAVEYAAQAAIAAGFKSFLLSVGGDVRVGASPRGRPPIFRQPAPGDGYWNIGVSNPDGGDLLDVLQAVNTSVFSSGDDMRYFVIDGQRFHHIIDPRTLMPAANHRSATVLHPDGSMADILSIAAFILEIDEAKELLAGFGAEAIWMLQDGSIATTDNWR